VQDFRRTDHERQIMSANSKATTTSNDYNAKITWQGMGSKGILSKTCAVTLLLLIAAPWETWMESRHGRPAVIWAAATMNDGGSTRARNLADSGSSEGGGDEKPAGDAPAGEGEPSPENEGGDSVGNDTPADDNSGSPEDQGTPENDENKQEESSEGGNDGQSGEGGQDGSTDHEKTEADEPKSEGENSEETPAAETDTSQDDAAADDHDSSDHGKSMKYSDLSKITPDVERKYPLYSTSATADLQAKYGRWNFWDGEEDKRPSKDYCGAYPNRDIPGGEFPEEAWQVDAVFVNHIINDASELISVRISHLKRTVAPRA
jgi:hypothetical protein